LWYSLKVRVNLEEKRERTKKGRGLGGKGGKGMGFLAKRPSSSSLP
jgi:hypothetical protein